jgi:hypothetical protein
LFQAADKLDILVSRPTFEWVGYKVGYYLECAILARSLVVGLIVFTCGFWQCAAPRLKTMLQLLIGLVAIEIDVNLDTDVVRAIG